MRYTQAKLRVINAFKYVPIGRIKLHIDDGTGDWANGLISVLRSFGFQILSLVHDNEDDGHIITADDFSSYLEIFRNQISSWNNLHPNQKAVAIIYMNSHGGADGEEYRFHHGDCHWSEKKLENKFDLIGQSLDFLWLATCYSWEFRDHLDDIDNVGNIIFWGRESVSWTGGESDDFFDSIIVGKSIDQAINDVADEDNKLKQKDNYDGYLDLTDPSLIGS